MDDVEQVVALIRREWPFIDEGEARHFLRGQVGKDASLVSVLTSLWVLKRVIEHKTTT